MSLESTTVPAAVFFKVLSNLLPLTVIVGKAFKIWSKSEYLPFLKQHPKLREKSIG